MTENSWLSCAECFRPPHAVWSRCGDRLITANQPFGEWNRIFPDPAMTLAAVDRLVHHATIFEMNVESYRRRTAVQRRTGAGRPPTYATIKTVEQAAPSDNQAAT